MVIKKYKIVEVEWLDAQSGFGQAMEIKDVIDWDPIITYSVGYLIGKNKNGIILGFMLFGDDMVKHNQLIPLGMIRKVRHLK